MFVSVAVYTLSSEKKQSRAGVLNCIYIWGKFFYVYDLVLFWSG